MFDYMRQNSITKSKHNTKVENFVIPIESSSINSIALDAVRMENDNWLYGCTAVQSSGDLTTCTEFVNLSAKSKIMPSKGKRKLFQVKKIGSFSLILLIFGAMELYYKFSNFEICSFKEFSF